MEDETGLSPDRFEAVLASICDGTTTMAGW